MKSKEELEELYRRELMEERKKAESFVTDHPDIPKEIAEKTQRERLEQIEKAESNFSYEFSAFVANECLKVVQCMEGQFGQNCTNIGPQLQAVKDNGFWKRSGIGNRLGIEIEEMQELMSQMSPAPFMTADNKDAVVQALYNNAGFDGILPTTREIAEFDERDGSLAAVASEMAGRKRNGNITYGTFNRIAQSSDNPAIQKALEEMKKRVLDEQEKDDKGVDDKGGDDKNSNDEQTRDE